MSQLITIILPDIGEGVVEGEVIQWLKQPGDPVGKDEPVVVVMTDKATVELPSPAAGSLAECFYQAGQIAKVGKPLYSISTSAEGAKEIAPSTEVKPSEKAEKLVEKPLPKKSTPHGDHVLALPSTRHLAKELGIDIDSVCGTGKDGRVIPKDLHAPVEAVQPREEDTVEPITGIRRLMLKKMADSKRTIPHFSYFERVDATRLIQLRQKILEEAEKESIHLTYMPFFIKALSLTLHKYPKINSSVDAEKASLHLHRHHNIGIAMATEQGLIVPVIKQVEKMSLADVIHVYEELKLKASSNSFTPQDMRDSTITISNFGAVGDGIWATPIIQPPETAILAISKIAPMPVASHDSVVIKNMIHLSWSFDHRIIDGHLAAVVSHSFAQLLQNPAGML